MDAILTLEENFTLHQTINTVTWEKFRKDLLSTMLMILAAAFILYHGTDAL